MSCEWCGACHHPDAFCERISRPQKRRVYAFASVRDAFVSPPRRAAAYRQPTGPSSEISAVAPDVSYLFGHDARTGPPLGFGDADDLPCFGY
jgi:hypothetical protein